jgi:hypothetical protein
MPEKVSQGLVGGRPQASLGSALSHESGHALCFASSPVGSHRVLTGLRGRQVVASCLRRSDRVLQGASPSELRISSES